MKKGSAASLLLAAMVGCADGEVGGLPNGLGGADGGSGAASASVSGPPFQEIYDQGLTRYVGTSVVQATSVTRSIVFPNVDVHHFAAPGRGPICMRGAEYFVETREGPSEDLLIFLEGGGVCLDEICAATVAPLLSLRTLTAGDLIGIGGVLDKTDARNPLASYDVVHVPYCDGSIFLGDVDRVLSDGKPLNGPNDRAYQRGLLNATAALETARATFPSPRRIVLAGTSGGSYGLLVGVALARFYYPDVPILAVGDSGAPILTAEDPGFVQRIVTELGGASLVPRSCPDCLANGHATGVLEWALERDPDLSFAYLGHARDHVIGEFFMGSTKAQFEASVVRETGRLASRFPGRAHRFIVPGSRHTLTLDVSTVPDGLFRTVIGLFGPAALTGDDVTRSELSRWVLGGLRETGTEPGGATRSGYDWLRTVIEHPERSVDVVSLGD